MTEQITQMRRDIAIAVTNDFLEVERGVQTDGDFASGQLAERVMTVHEQAEKILRAQPLPPLPGFYVPLSKKNAGDYSDIAAVLPGYIVLVKASLVDRNNKSAFYPAVVSEGDTSSDDMRLHVFRQPYHQQIGYGTSMMLSAAGQFETKGIGDHGRVHHDGVEAEHFATLLVAGSNDAVRSAWQSGVHQNHTWRGQPSNSVSTQVANLIFGESAQQRTVTITRAQVEAGQAMLFWHEGMMDTDTPETATKDRALVVMQGLGFQALQDKNSGGIDVVKRLLS